MILVKPAQDLSKLVDDLKKNNRSIGFVATMGALHKGHIALIERSKRENDTTVCSIFVNPTQFNDPKDLEKYPRPIDKDIILLTEAGTDILFLPDPEDIYPSGYREPEIHLGNLEHVIEGAQRPGHFKGVAMVVKQLFEFVRPDRAYFGQKDFQQTLVVKELVRQFKLPVKVIVHDILREDNGLAMSSRNVRLSPEARKNAGFVYDTLLELKAESQVYPLREALQRASDRILTHNGARIEYLKVVHPESLETVQELSATQPAIALLVVNYEGVRLLDNLYL